MSPVYSVTHVPGCSVRGKNLSMGFDPPHPRPLPCGERERAEFAALFVSHPSGSCGSSPRARRPPVGTPAAVYENVHCTRITLRARP